MKEVTINISSTGFPSQFVSDAEKATDEFGLQIGKLFSTNGLRRTVINAGFIINGKILIVCDCTRVENNL
jgi:hypothetical protein